MVLANFEGAIADLCIDGVYIEQVKQFKYLGATITEYGRSKTEVERRTGIAKSKFSELSKLLTSRQISLTLKYIMLQCYVFSVFMYSAETWTFGQEICKKVNSFEMWRLRRTEKVSWKDR
jgi:hypothetical protein